MASEQATTEYSKLLNIDAIRSVIVIPHKTCYFSWIRNVEKLWGMCRIFTRVNTLVNREMYRHLYILTMIRIDRLVFIMVAMLHSPHGLLARIHYGGAASLASWLTGFTLVMFARRGTIAHTSHHYFTMLSKHLHVPPQITSDVLYSHSRCSSSQQSHMNNRHLQ